MDYDFSRKASKNTYPEFAKFIMNIYQQNNDSWSSRGWCYLLEQLGVIDKTQFGKVNTWITTCMKKGLLPVDIISSDNDRMFTGVYKSEHDSIDSFISSWFNAALDCGSFYKPDYYNNKEENVYVQCLVEKSDLVKIFKPVCEDYLIPIANGKGWQSVLQRATYTQRFKEAEASGMKCVLIYYGDYDPDGLRISETLKKNLFDISSVTWLDGSRGYNPEKLKIKRIGIKLQFIKKNKITWIDNLITGNKNKKMDLSKPSHPNHKLEYVQKYLKKIGPRKCEANAIVTCKEAAQEEFRKEIIKLLGADCISRREKYKRKIERHINKKINQAGAYEAVESIIGNL